MEHSEKLARIRLIRTQNVGPMTYKLLMRRYKTAKEVLRVEPELAKRGGRKLIPASLDAAEAEFAANEAAAATLLLRVLAPIPWPSMTSSIYVICLPKWFGQHCLIWNSAVSF